MKSYLEKRIGKSLGVTRAGMPKEVYFEAELLGIEGEVAMFKGESGECAVAIDKIIMVGLTEKADSKKPPGFAAPARSKKK